MTIKEIKEDYKVETYDRGKTLILSHKTKNGIYAVSKFLVALNKVKPGVYEVQASKCPNSWKINHTSMATAKWAILKQLIGLRVKDYDFNSEFYNPMYREGYMEELAVRNHLTDRLDFKYLDSQWGIDAYEKTWPGVYGKGEYRMLLHINGLDLIGGFGGSKKTIKDKVSVSLSMRDGSWVEVKVDRKPEEIANTIDSLIRPEILVLAKNLLNYSHILNSVEINPTMKEPSGALDITEKNIKKEMIQQLEQTLKSLRGH